MYQDKYGRKWDAKPHHDAAMLLRVKPEGLRAALKLQHAQGLIGTPGQRFFEKNQCYLFRSEFEWEAAVQYAEAPGDWDSWILDDRIAEYLLSRHRQQADEKGRLAIEAIDRAYPPPGVEHEVWAVLGKRRDGTLPSPVKSMSAPERDWLYHTEEEALEARDAVTQYYGREYAGVYRCLLRVVSEVKPTKE